MLGCPTDIASIERGVALHGAAPNSAAMLNAEVTAARESISTELYIIWSPMPHRNGTGQCCRIGSPSICMCGHALQSHFASLCPRINTRISSRLNAQTVITGAMSLSLYTYTESIILLHIVYFKYYCTYVA